MILFIAVHVREVAREKVVVVHEVGPRDQEVVVVLEAEAVLEDLEVAHVVLEDLEVVHVVQVAVQGVDLVVQVDLKVEVAQEVVQVQEDRVVAQEDLAVVPSVPVVEGMNIIVLIATKHLILTLNFLADPVHVVVLRNNDLEVAVDHEVSLDHHQQLKRKELSLVIQKKTANQKYRNVQKSQTLIMKVKRMKLIMMVNLVWKVIIHNVLKVMMKVLLIIMGKN